MKKIKCINEFFMKGACAIGLLISLPVTSCSSSHFSRIYDVNTLNSGMVYCLPTTKIEVSVTKAGETMSISAKPIYVADREYRYTLTSNTNPLFGIDHEVEIENSLLKTVGSDDTGEIGEIAKALASAIISPPIAVGSLSKPERELLKSDNRTEEGEREETRPTLEEYKKTLASIPDGTQTLIFDRNGGVLSLPGSDGLINIQVSIADPIKVPEINLERLTNSLNRTGVAENAYKNKNFNGFLSRTLLSEHVDIKVSYKPQRAKVASIPIKKTIQPKGDSPVLKLLRLQSAKLSERIDKRESEYDTYKQELLNFWRLPIKRHEEELELESNEADQKKSPDTLKQRDTAYFKELSTRMLELRKHIEELQAENFKIDMRIAELDTPKETPASKPPQYVGSQDGTLSDHGFIMSMTDDSSAIHIPTKRGAVGKTTQGYGFSSGVLVKSEVSQPSQVLGVLKIPTEVAKEIVSVPAELFGKINTARTAEASIIAQEKAIFDNELGLLKAQDSLESYQKLTDEQSDKLDRMRRELEILRLEKDISDLGGILPPP